MISPVPPNERILKQNNDLIFLPSLNCYLWVCFAYPLMVYRSKFIFPLWLCKMFYYFLISLSSLLLCTLLVFIFFLFASLLFLNRALIPYSSNVSWDIVLSYLWIYFSCTQFNVILIILYCHPTLLFDKLLLPILFSQVSFQHVSINFFPN